MPRISEFYGIIIFMYHRDHAPPHFHAAYGSEEVQVDIRSFAVIDGRIPPRQLGRVIEWAALHRAELERAWGQAQRREPIDRIEPLP